MKAYCVETAAIRYNLEKLTRLAGKTPIWAVLKGNGYGLGTGEMAKLCHEAGIRRFCVTEISEAMDIRMQFAQAEILMLRPTTDLGELQQMLDLDVIATISCSAEAAALNSLAGQRGTVAEVHVKVDTGMGRYGFMPHDTEKILSVYLHNDNLAVSGIYTHFHSAFCNENSVFAQAETFKGVLNALIKAGVDPGAAHCCNSAAFLRWPELHMGGVRLGSALLGRVLVKADLRRVGRCEATVDEIRWLPTGHSTGYGAAWKAKKPTRTAVIPVGWYHGFAVSYGDDIFRIRDCIRAMLRALKNMLRRKKLYVRINGSLCPVLGHVGMLHTVCDITKANCSVGDTAILDINPLQVRGMEIRYQ